MKREGLAYAHASYEEIERLKMDLFSIDLFINACKSNIHEYDRNDMTVIRFCGTNEKKSLGDIIIESESMKEAFIEFLTKSREEIEDKINDIYKKIDAL